MWRAKSRVAKQQMIGGWATSPAAEKLKFSPAAAQKLLQNIQGSIVLSTDASYNQARQLSDAAYQWFPQIIVYCNVLSDVKEALAFARAHDLWPVCRSGGHCTAGFSANDEMIIDLGNLNYAAVNPDSKRVVTGAGTNFGHLNATLDTYRLHVPSGGCEDVRVGGYSQGGGYGFTSRMFGVNCDSLVEALVMLADGSIVKANNNTNADLFWAIRGGTGNNFGVLLQSEYRLHDVWQVWGCSLVWPVDYAAGALELMQTGYMRTGDPALGYMTFIIFLDPEEQKQYLHISGASETKAFLFMQAMYVGDADAGRRVMQPLVDLPGTKQLYEKTGSYFEMNRVLLETPFDFPLVPDLSRETKDCAYIATPLQQPDWQTLIDAFLKAPNAASMFLVEPYGGAINQVASDATAFVHRDADFDLVVDVFWMNATERQNTTAFLDDFFEVAHGFWNNRRYQNYPRLENPDYKANYWGQNYPRLCAVKRKYDPDNFFHYAQSIDPLDYPEAAPAASGLIAHEPYGQAKFASGASV